MQRAQLKVLLWTLLALFLPTLAGLAVIDSGLKVPASPGGIISFEFCGFASSCDATLEQWGVPGQKLALLSLGLDYLFLVVYPSLICVGLLLVSERVPVQWKTLTIFFAWLSLGAGIADAVENFLLIRIILSGLATSSGVVAAVFASAKFAVLGIAVFWLAFSCFASARRRHA